MGEEAPFRVVVACDSFKGSLTSLEVADAVRLGLLDVAPGASVVVVPVADGGEGTVAAALASGWTGVAVEVHGPTGEPVSATLAVRAAPESVVAALDSAALRLSTAEPPDPAPDTAAPPLSTAQPPAPTLGSAALRLSTAEPPAPAPDTAAPPLSTAQPPAPTLDSAAPPLGSVESPANPFAGPSTGPARATVVVEMADCCGLGRLPGGIPAPLTASSRGLGEAVRAAFDLGADEVVVGVGGSASTDGGAGLLAALGARLLAADGHELPDGGAALAGLGRLDLSELDPRLAATRLVLAADVDSPLLGPAGAAAVFAPQKGATPDDVVALEAALTRWAEVIGAPSGLPGAGAAGGVGIALLAVLGAERRSGVDVVLDLVGLESALTGADLVVTGEGALDAQTLAGKAVAGVARRAGAHGIPVVAVCGRLDLDEAGLATLGVRAAYPLTDLEPDPQRSRVDARELVRRTGRRIAQDWLSPAPG